jgi:ribosomal protein L11 methylase PrmA
MRAAGARNERAYQQALSTWQDTAAFPEKHPQWSAFYANALRDALRQADARRQEALAALTTADWRSLVYRELPAERWYEEPEDNLPLLPVQEMDIVPFAQRAKANGNGLHARGGAV